MGLILAIDWDNVIHDRQHPVAGKKLGGLMEGAEEALDDLYRAGYTIIIHTTMANSPSGRKAVVDWLQYYGIDYHEIVPKPKADYYIDDKAIKFKNWDQALQEIGADELDWNFQGPD